VRVGVCGDWEDLKVLSYSNFEVFPELNDIQYKNPDDVRKSPQNDHLCAGLC